MEHPEIKPRPQRPDVAGAPKINPTDGAEMVFVPGGTFTMGDTDQSNNPPHKVTLPGYYIYKNLVTVAQYEKFCAESGRRMPPATDINFDWKHKDHPMIMMSWYDAQAYCKWASVRLPTDAEWEKATRGTDGRKYPWGNTFDYSRLSCSKSANGDVGGTSPVGSFPSGASPYGVLDMVGSVWQWCDSLYDGEHDWRVRRGGGWNYFMPAIFRTAHRETDDPGFKSGNNGFRCASKD